MKNLDKLAIKDNIVIATTEKSVEEIAIPKSVEKIGNSSFSNCQSLQKVTFPKSLKEIGTWAFYNCKALEKLDTPNSVEKIGSQAFFNCISLKDVTLSDSLKELGNQAFSNCASLEKITLPNSLKELKGWTFYNCKSLKEVTMPKSLKEIGDCAFYNCKTLEKLEIPNSVEKIGDEAFRDCTSLKEVIVPESVKELGNRAFDGCTNLKSLKILGISSNEYFRANNINSYSCQFYYITKDKDKFVLDAVSAPLKKLSKNQIRMENPYLINYYIRFFDDEKNIKFLNQIDNSLSKYIAILDDKNFKEKKEFNFEDINKFNIKNFNSLANEFNFENEQNRFDFIKLCGNLGIFMSEPVTEKRISKSGNVIEEKIPYFQKAKEFLKERMLEGSLKPNEMHAMFDNMKPEGFKKEFVDFFLNKANFEELIQEERKQSGFISRCYNEFENVQNSHTSQRGSQRQLAPTVKFFKGYFATNKFKGVTEKTSEIALTISPYFSDQENFDKAVEIAQEKESRNVPDNILEDEYLKEEDVFEKVDSLLNKTKGTLCDTTSTLVDLANKKFTYELLSKSDPVNFVLGKLCSCCAHLEGAGNGIMRASIVHPDVQNIVIRDKKGEIVAKSTLYVNRNEGYGVCNNVEVNNNVMQEDRKLVYDKYKKAVETFAEKYNEKYPKNPLKVITVGMSLNDLSDIIKKNDKESTVIHEALNYGEYAFDGAKHNGDSSKSQFIVWEQNKEAEVKNEK